MVLGDVLVNPQGCGLRGVHEGGKQLLDGPSADDEGGGGVGMSLEGVAKVVDGEEVEVEGVGGEGGEEGRVEDEEGDNVGGRGGGGRRRGC